MNNNIDRITKGIAMACFEDIKVAVEDGSSRKEVMRGGGSAGGTMTRLLMPRPIQKIRISEDALKICLENNIPPANFFILTDTQKRNKYNSFFSSNKKKIEDSHKIGHYLTGDHNAPNSQIIIDMFEEYISNPNCSWKNFLNILNNQSYDLITLEENEKLNNLGFQKSGTKSQRDEKCSKKINFVDMWLTPKELINNFFDTVNIKKNECMDPCAADDRWLNNEGYSIDILPQNINVIKKDFLSISKKDVPEKVKYIVGNIPFSLTKEFINKALELRDEAYFLVNGESIFNYFPENIEHIYIFSGLEGNQKDNRSRSEFDVPFLIKSALWTCIVHIKKDTKQRWNIRKDLSNSEKRDGFHVALGKNIFIESEKCIDENKNITKINVKSSIIWKNGKKIKIDDKIIDLKNFNYLDWKR